jgi:hypothetical protein
MRWNGQLSWKKDSQVKELMGGELRGVELRVQGRQSCGCVQVEERWVALKRGGLRWSVGGRYVVLELS